MDYKSVTKKVMAAIGAIIVFVLIYDAYAISKGGTEASISSMIINASYTMPFGTHFGVFCLGILFGHLFWRMRPNKDTIKNGIDKISDK